MGTRISGTDGHRGGTRPAFTLIELLVVIAIIALLIAILLPSLEAARRQSKLSTCLSHIKNVATSSRVYEADDPSGWGIPVNSKQYDQCPGQLEGGTCSVPMFVGAYEWGGKSGIGQDDFLTGSPGNPINSKYGSKVGVGPATRPMNRILYPGGITNAWTGRVGFGDFNVDQGDRDTRLDFDLFKCPADNGPPRGAHCEDWVKNSERSSYDHFGNSYASNVFMTANAQDVSEMFSNSPYMRPTSRVPTPARTLYFEENIGRWAWSCMRERCDGNENTNGLDLSPGVWPGPTKTLRGWHGKDWTFNRAFVDAHAETQRVYIEGTEDADGYAFHYRWENVYPDNPGWQEGMQCIIVRGPGWQKDTLPSPRISTGLMHDGEGRPSYERCVESGGGM